MSVTIVEKGRVELARKTDGRRIGTCGARIRAGSTSIRNRNGNINRTGGKALILV